MPTVLPVEGPVTWPVDEGVIGVVGVAPWATLDFLRAVYSRVSAQKDWHYPRVLCDINTKLPSRGRYFDLGERDPSPFIADTIKELAEHGATLVVVPCNTAHLLYDRWSAGAPVPVPSIVEATVSSIVASGALRVVTFASKSLSAHGLYDSAVEAAGIAPEPQALEGVALVGRAIESVKQTGAVSEALLAELGRMLDLLRTRGVDGVILGCTELQSLQPLCESKGLHVAESNAALAVAALRGVGLTPTAL